jgi:hypothetical protein
MSIPVPYVIIFSNFMLKSHIEQYGYRNVLST